jgi:hypothetical protein
MRRIKSCIHKRLDAHKSMHWSVPWDIKNKACFTAPHTQKMRRHKLNLQGNWNVMQSCADNTVGFLVVNNCTCVTKRLHWDKALSRQTKHWRGLWMQNNVQMFGPPGTLGITTYNTRANSQHTHTQTHMHTRTRTCTHTYTPEPPYLSCGGFHMGSDLAQWGPGNPCPASLASAFAAACTGPPSGPPTNAHVVRQHTQQTSGHYAAQTMQIRAHIVDVKPLRKHTMQIRAHIVDVKPLR